MDRKAFIRTCGFAALGVPALVPVLQGCAAGTRYASATLDGKILAVAKSEFGSVNGAGDATRAFVLVKVDFQNRPICVYRNGPGSFTALSTLCTHQGCEVRPNTEYLACPCHGSEFSTTGQVLQGPAEINLKSFPVTTDDETVYIHV